MDITQAAADYLAKVQAQNAFVDQVRTATQNVAAAQAALDAARAAEADPVAGFAAAQAATAVALAALEAAALGGVVVETV
jgi:hypothetical protein